MSKVPLEYLIEDLFAYRTLEDLQEIFGYSRECIRKYAKDKGWDQDWRWKFRWKEDEDILGEDDYSYYFLGYFLGDGSLEKRSEKHRNRYGVTVYSAETQVLSQLRDFLRIDTMPKREREGRKGNMVKSWTREYRIDKNSKPIYEWLQSKGIVNNKCVEGVVLKGVLESDYFFSFLRGLLDSDGSVENYLDSNSHSAITWFGEMGYIADIASTLEYYGYHPKFYTSGSVFRVKISNVREIRQIYKEMYNSDMYMRRKEQKIKEIVDSNIRGSSPREFEFVSSMRPHHYG